MALSYSEDMVSCGFTLDSMEITVAVSLFAYTMFVVPFDRCFFTTA